VMDLLGEERVLWGSDFSARRFQSRSAASDSKLNRTFDTGAAAPNCSARTRDNRVPGIKEIFRMKTENHRV